MDLQLWKKKRKELKLNYEDLAKLANVSKRTIEDIFRGYTTSPRIDTVEAIEKALGINQEPKNDFNKIPVALYEGINGLSEEGMQDVLRYVEFVKSKEKEKGGK